MNELRKVTWRAGWGKAFHVQGVTWEVTRGTVVVGTLFIFGILRARLGHRLSRAERGLEIELFTVMLEPCGFWFMVRSGVQRLCHRYYPLRAGGWEVGG